MEGAPGYYRFFDPVFFMPRVDFVPRAPPARLRVLVVELVRELAVRVFVAIAR